MVMILEMVTMAALITSMIKSKSPGLEAQTRRYCMSKILRLCYCGYGLVNGKFYHRPVSVEQVQQKANLGWKKLWELLCEIQQVGKDSPSVVQAEAVRDIFRRCASLDGGARVDSSSLKVRRGVKKGGAIFRCSSSVFMIMKEMNG